jgi:hypothetical protein
MHQKATAMMTPSLLLPSPTVRCCYFDIGFVPPLAAMELDWPKEGNPGEQTWLLPSGEVVRSRLPERFGLRIRRQAEDAYAVTLLWGAVYRQWYSLRRQELLPSALGPVLAAMGTPLLYLLDQPIGPPDRTLPAAA